jgi:hypothetical protein
MCIFSNEPLETSQKNRRYYMGIGSIALYTWESCKGNLSLFNQGGKYRLRYETKDHQTIEIPEKSVMGLSLENLPSEIDEFCQNYFFRVQNKNDRFSIIFFESDFRDNFTPIESTVQKALGSVSFGFNKLEKKEKISFSPQAPNYRIVCRGLNLEGKCTNKVCEAFNKNVIVPKGLGEFHIAEELDQSQCPACDENILFKNIRNLGFWNCKFKIVGKQLSPEEKQVSKSDTAEKKHYTTYQEDDDCTWAYLNVTTSTQENVTISKQDNVTTPKQTHATSHCVII